MRAFLMVAGLAGLMGVAGCHSAFVDAAVINRTERVIPLVEVDYPSASFGTENLAPGGVYHYRFKVLGSGEMKAIYTDSSKVEHTAKGPELHEGAEGPMEVAITPVGVEWKMDGLKRR